jgi:hypothetical protein
LPCDGNRDPDLYIHRAAWLMIRWYGDDAVGREALERVDRAKLTIFRLRLWYGLEAYRSVMSPSS